MLKKTLIPFSETWITEYGYRNMEPLWFQIDSSRIKFGSYIVQQGYISHIGVHNASIPPSRAVLGQ